MDWYSYDDYSVEAFQHYKWLENKNKHIFENVTKVYNAIYDRTERHKEEKPYIILYKSKPIRGIVLELWGKNPKYNW